MKKLFFTIVLIAFSIGTTEEPCDQELTLQALFEKSKFVFLCCKKDPFTSTKLLFNNKYSYNTYNFQILKILKRYGHDSILTNMQSIIVEKYDEAMNQANFTMSNKLQFVNAVFCYHPEINLTDTDTLILFLDFIRKKKEPYKYWKFIARDGYESINKLDSINILRKQCPYHYDCKN